MTTVEIPLPCGRVTLIDEHNWCLAEPYAWYALTSKKTIYVRKNLQRF